MRKKCGYFPGYCLCPGACPFTVLGYPSPGEWAGYERAAKFCKWRAAKNQAGRETYASMRRRRDWQVGNPYEGR